MRILHVLAKLDRGGVETWLMQLLRHVDRSRYEMDFVVHTTDPGAYDNQVRALGAKIIPCLHSSNPLQYAVNFGKILKSYGPYDCIHSHVHHYSGFVLFLGRLYGVPARIAHSHTGQVEAEAGPVRKAYLTAMRQLISWNANAVIAVSQVAADSLLTARKRDGRCLILPCGVDVTKFDAPSDRVHIRKSLDISPEAHVIGHVGRFVELKNHRKIIEIARELCPTDPSAHFLLVGDGPLRPLVEAEIANCGLRSRFTLTGNRADVPHLLQGAMDLFLFPSKYEGLPVALMEAQLAGLTCVASDSITREAALHPFAVEWMPLEASSAEWAHTLRSRLARQKRHVVTPAARSRVSIQTSAQQLMHIYHSLVEEQVDGVHQETRFFVPERSRTQPAEDAEIPTLL
jgi:glycosyltransferase involved in cell wall biosynthesis